MPDEVVNVENQSTTLGNTSVNTTSPTIDRQRMDADIVCVGFGPAMGGFLTTLARALARVLWSTRHLGIAWTGYDAILPVPLHPDRLRTRRFNQALLLLWSLPQRGLPVRAQWLVRTRATAPQVSLPDDHRHTNVRHRQTGRVVDAVANHSHPFAFGHETANGRHLLFWL